MAFYFMDAQIRFEMTTKSTDSSLIECTWIEASVMDDADAYAHLICISIGCTHFWSVVASSWFIYGLKA